MKSISPYLLLLTIQVYGMGAWDRLPAYPRYPDVYTYWGGQLRRGKDVVGHENITIRYPEGTFQLLNERTMVGWVPGKVLLYDLHERALLYEVSLEELFVGYGSRDLPQNLAQAPGVNWNEPEFIYRGHSEFYPLFYIHPEAEIGVQHRAWEPYRGKWFYLTMGITGDNRITLESVTMTEVEVSKEFFSRPFRHNNHDVFPIDRNRYLGWGTPRIPWGHPDFHWRQGGTPLLLYTLGSPTQEIYNNVRKSWGVGEEAIIYQRSKNRILFLLPDHSLFEYSLDRKTVSEIINTRDEFLFYDVTVLEDSIVGFVRFFSEHIFFIPFQRDRNVIFYNNTLYRIEGIIFPEGRGRNRGRLLFRTWHYFGIP